ncbi:AAA family ATPase [Candidatus Parabeggiatoa sp. HSG14]|uniref:AAA family ATPase n=1 Tax=Candidatus Parabeggiatoa sp. HSG14 TaxID=3055593 RepID=UPI0025A8C8A3|nr:AAA family ATPase [Thiotrichales bacterium HSG14]
MTNTAKPKIFQPEIKVKEISIENFRGFENLKLKFQPDLTVLIGENGAGKTAVLDCLALLLFLFQEHIQDKGLKSLEKLFDLLDIKQGQLSTSNQVYLRLDSAEINCKIDFNKNKRQFEYFSSSYPSTLESIIEKYNSDTVLPLFVYYPTNNAPVNSIDFKNASDNFATDIFSAYENALDKKSFDFVNFFNWYKWQENIEKQIGENKTLDAVRNAIYKLLSDEHDAFDKLSINWLNNPNGEMMIYKGETPLNINQLSSGEKTLLALVADLARRLAITNPHRENPLMGNGVVLIDEIDLHLHPRWQRAVLPQLQKTFPNCQLIVTTHSPLVLSNISHQNVIILEDFQPVKITPHTFGRDNNSILYELMGVKQRPDDIQQQLDKVYELIDEGKKSEAQILLEELSKDLGENDAAIVQAYVSLNFMDIDDETN